MKKILLILFFQPFIVFAQNIGINELVPEMRLHVKALDSAVILLHNPASSGSNIKTGLFFKTGTSYSGAVASIGSSATHRMGLFTFGGSLPSALKERISILDGGDVGINTTTPSAKLDVNGNANFNGTIKIGGGLPGVGKLLTSDAAGNASWQTVTPSIVNQQYEFTAYNLSTTIQDSEVDFPGTNLTVPVTGTYLINYYLDAYNTFSLNCVNNCGSPIVFFTNAYLYNKTSPSIYQVMKIDFSLQDHSSVASSSIITYSCPEHQVSGSVVKALMANDQIGFKMRSFAEAGVTAEIRIRSSSITLVRLY